MNEASASGATPSRPLGYRVQLDGLRAIAVTFTVIHHWIPDVFLWRSWFPYGVAGVRLFFVLSGFLITTILLDQRFAIDAGQQERGRSLKHFFLRRLLRLVPVFYVTLLLGAAFDLGALRETLLWHLAYLSNLGMILDGRWLPGITHLWSLAVEEQFYILWAGMMLWLPRRAIVPSIVLAIVAAPVFRTTGVLLGWQDMTIGFNPVACLDTLGFGALLAVMWRSDVHPTLARHRERVLRAGLTIGLPVLVLTIVGEKTLGEAFRRGVSLPIQETALAGVFVWLVARANTGFGGLVGAFLSNRLIVGLGIMSYAVYLIHPIVAIVVVKWIAIGWTYWPTVAMSAFLTLSISWLSWQFIEAPARRFGRRFAYVERDGKSPLSLA